MACRRAVDMTGEKERQKRALVKVVAAIIE